MPNTLRTERRARLEFPQTFTRFWAAERPAWWGDLIIIAGLAVLLWVGVRLALGAPRILRGRDISLSPTVLPYYAAL